MFSLILICSIAKSSIRALKKRRSSLRGTQLACHRKLYTAATSKQVLTVVVAILLCSTHPLSGRIHQVVGQDLAICTMQGWEPTSQLLQPKGTLMLTRTEETLALLLLMALCGVVQLKSRYKPRKPLWPAHVSWED